MTRRTPLVEPTLERFRTPSIRKLSALAVLPLGLASGACAKDRIIGIEHKAPGVSAHDGKPLSLYLWKKRIKHTPPAQFAQAGRVVLLAHGATVSGRPDFDLQLALDKRGLTYSLMDYLAAQGYDVFSDDYQN